MDEIEYKLNTKNSVLVVNAIDKLINTIKSKYKPAERQRFVLENEELKYLREKCSSKEAIVSLTACQGLLALVELGVLEIAHTMSTVVTLLPTAHNYSAIISTMAGLLVLDLKSRLVPGQSYKCQFSLKSPQHPFITVLERNKAAEDDVFAQMQALCTHPDYIVQSNSLELLRPVFLYLTCNPQREGSIKPWQLLLSLPQTEAQCDLLLACLSCQQMNTPSSLVRSFGAYSAVTDAVIYQQNEEYIAALMPMLARLSNQFVLHCVDPRPCYRLISRCISGGHRPSAGLTLHLLATNITRASALCLHDTFALCLTILTKYDCPSIAVNALISYTLQWLYLPSHLTTSALKIAAEILDFYQNKYKPKSTLDIPNLKCNKVFNYLSNTDSKLIILVKLHSVWERIRDNPDKLNMWLDDVNLIDDKVKLELLPFFYGLLMGDEDEELVLKVLKTVVNLVDYNKDVAVELLPILVYKIANVTSPVVKLECLRALPLMAKSKENVPAIVSILNKLKVNKGVPTSFLILLFATLAETQVRCFPYLHELLVEPGTGRPDDLKWEIDIARISAIKRICELRASSHGLELVPLISATLNRCTDRAGGAAAALSLRSIAALWARAALAPPAAWRALQPRLEHDQRPLVHESIFYLLGTVPSLSSNTLEWAALARGAAARLWRGLAEGEPTTAVAAAKALANYSIDLYKLKDIPEIYRKTVKLPASYCKTPADAARKPEDVLDYIPCEVWPEVFKYTNQAALSGVVVLLRGVVSREAGGYRSGVFLLEGGREPAGCGGLPHSSAVRGLMDFCRKQITSPSHECPDEVTLAILETLSSEFPKPLPPLDMSFVLELCARGGLWRRWGVTLAARMAKVSPSARSVIENWVQGIQNGTAEESDIMLFYELLPTLTKNFPPNTLRPPLERSLTDAFTQTANVKSKIPYEEVILNKINELKMQGNNKNSEEEEKSIEEEHLFIKQLKLVKSCLDCDSIHDANRTLLSQLIENYFAIISDDNVAWPAYVETCTSLSSKYLERMTSPTSWWEVTPTALRKAGAVRSGVAASGAAGTNPLYWLNELIDAHAHEYTEQNFSLSYIFVCSVIAGASTESKEWFLQLLARTQAAFKESEEQNAKRYLYSVVCVCAAAASGVWTVRGAPLTAGAGGRAPPPGELLPAALATLLDKDDWRSCTLQVLEWLYHTRDCIDGDVAVSCHRTLLALRHTEPFATHKIWTRLESYFGKDIVQDC